jgi:hypothetical protein
MQTSKCASLGRHSSVGMAERAGSMQKAGWILQVLFRTVPSAKSLLISKTRRNLAAPTLYRASRRHSPYGGTLLVMPYERLIKQFRPISLNVNRWIDHTGNYIHADALKEKTQPGR